MSYILDDTTTFAPQISFDNDGEPVIVWLEAENDVLDDLDLRKEYHESGRQRDSHGRWVAGGGGEADKAPKGKYFNGGRDGSISTALEYGHEFAAVLNTGEKYAVQYYTHQGDSELNGRIRGRGHKAASNILARQTELLDGALKKSGGLPENTVMYRGLQSIPDGMRVGMSFTEPGYTSVSRSRDVASEFTGEEGGALLHIKYPAGTPGADVEALTKHRNEQEFLTARGTTFHIDKMKEPGKDGITHIYAHVVLR